MNGNKVHRGERDNERMRKKDEQSCEIPSQPEQNH